MSDRHLYLAIAVVVIATWMLRWEVTAGSGTDNTSVLHFKLDRFTGTSYTCAGWCEVDEISD
jgi:hypothetical protein